MRTAIFILAGLLLLLANLWFIQAVHRSLFARDLVIAPFEILPKDGSGQRQSEALARVLNVRLASILRDLANARREATTEVERQDVMQKAAQTPAATLFLPEEVIIPSDLLRPVDLKLAVAGVEVGGILAFAQRAVLRPKMLTFTVIEKGETAAVTADLSGLVDEGDPYLSLECRNTADEIAAATAYALIQKRVGSSAQRSWREYFGDIFGGRRTGTPSTRQLASLEPSDFRTLLEGLIATDRLNEKVRRGYVVDREFQEVLASIEPLTGKLPDYFELQYFVGSVAESAGNRATAVKWYRSVAAAPQRAVSDEIRDDAKTRLSPLQVAAFAAPPIEGEGPFIAEVEQFSELMGLASPRPAVVLKKPEGAGADQIQAFWNAQERRYEVNPAFAKTPGLPQYVALMGRFMALHYDRCFGGARPAGDPNFWNEFRHSMVDYLIQSVPAYSQVTLIGQRYPWFRVLKRIEERTGQPARRLALELLDRYQCEWNASNIEQHAVAIAEERGLVPPDVVRDAFVAERPPAAVRRRRRREP